MSISWGTLNISWEAFDLNRFVGRQHERAQFKAWLRRPPGERRVYSYVGAAGTGKTWLLHALHHDLEQPDLQAELFCPIYVSFLNIVEDMEGNLSRYTASVHSWVKRVAEARGISSEITDELMAKQMVTILVKILCEDLKQRPVLFVEGYDEVEHALAFRLTNDLLYTFLSQPQTRIVMGRRDLKLQDVDLLRWSDQYVILESDAEGTIQFQSLLKLFANADHLPLEKLPALKLQVPDYGWNHYFINGYLFSTALSRPTASFDALITAADREACCQDLILRGGRRSMATLNLEFLPPLKKIAQQLARSWTEQELQSALQMRATAIEHLFVYGAISHDPERTQRYRIADGLYELLRALPSEES